MLNEEEMKRLIDWWYRHSSNSDWVCQRCWGMLCVECGHCPRPSCEGHRDDCKYK